MAYKGYKGCGPKGLGASPLKQDIDPTQLRLAEIKQTRENLAKKGETIETRKKESMVRNLKEDLGNVGSNQMQGSSGIFGMLGGPIGKGVTAIASKLFGSSKNKKALDAFLKASPKDPTKTTRLSHYNKATPKSLALSGVDHFEEMLQWLTTNHKNGMLTPHDVTVRN